MGNEAAPRFDKCKPSSKASSWAKQRTPSRATRPEMCLRRELWAQGLRYRVNVQKIVGKPDIVFRTQKVLIFCDGDFFHGRDWTTLRDKLARRANSSYWIRKIEYNRQRDREVDAELKQAGWRVLRFWESEINSDLERAVRDVESALRDTGL